MDKKVSGNVVFMFFIVTILASLYMAAVFTFGYNNIIRVYFPQLPVLDTLCTFSALILISIFKIGDVKKKYTEDEYITMMILFILSPSCSLFMLWIISLIVN